jgi:putative ABC transport system permease protein
MRAVMDTLLNDIRYSARKLVQGRAFTFIAVATLAIAIGATTAIFSIVNGVLLEPLPFRNPEQLVFIASTNRDGETNPMSTTDFIDYRDQSKSFVGMAAINTQTMNVTAAGAEPTRAQAAQVGARFFELLDVTPQRGRLFVDGEDADSAPRVAVLSDHLWRNQYGADPRIIGAPIHLDGEAYTIVGVAPSTVMFPANVDLFIPFVFASWQLDPENRGAHSHYAMGRVKDGISVEEASGELNAIAERLAVQYPESNTGFGGQAVELRERIIGKSDKPLYAMFGAVVLVLLIACANVANLLLVRAAGRESEMAVRTALGAGRSRIFRQLVTESVMLSVAGAVLGTLLASWAVDAVVAFGPGGLPRLSEVRVDGPVLAFAASLAVLTGIVFGLVPALHVSRPDIAQMLRESLRGTSRGGAQRTRSVLVVAEMGLAVVLLVGASLLIRSFVQLITVDPGFRPEKVVAFNLSLPSTKYQYERDVRALVATIEQRMRQVPGTRDVGITFGRPMDNTGFMRTTFEVDGWAASTPERRNVSQVHVTTPGYFRTLGIPLRRGRHFTDADNRMEAPSVVVVTEEFVRKYFPNEDPIGRQVRYGITHDTAEVGGGEAQVEGQIVGVVGDVKQRDLTTPAYPTTYVPFNKFAIGFFTVLVRTDGDERALQSGITSIIRNIDRDLPVFSLTTMEEAVSDSVAQPRFYMVLLGAFAVVALLLAALGIYGVISYLVSQRTRELGIRVALGATRRSIVHLVVSQGAVLAAIGVVTGVAGALALRRALASMVFGISEVDPVSLAVAPAVLLAAALLGCYLPARRAARVDPVIAMRND